jgi:hypothetical protein
MSQINSKSQSLEIIKKNPGLCGEEIGERCRPGIQVNTVLKNISHIRDEFGDGCIHTEMVKGKNDGVEYATYYWQGIGVNKGIEEKIADYRKIQATYPPGHRQREAIETQIRGIGGKIGQGVSKPV